MYAAVGALIANVSIFVLAVSSVDIANFIDDRFLTCEATVVAIVCEGLEMVLSIVIVLIVSLPVIFVPLIVVVTSIMGAALGKRIARAIEDSMGT